MSDLLDGFMDCNFGFVFAYQFQCTNFRELITLNLDIGPNAFLLYVYWLSLEKFTKNYNFNLYVFYGFD